MKDSCTHMLLSPFLSMDTHRVSRTEARSHARHPMASSSPFASHAHFSVPKLLNFSCYVRQRTSLFRFGEDLHGYIDCRYRARPSSIESQMREQLGQFVEAYPILAGASKMKG